MGIGLTKDGKEIMDSKPAAPTIRRERAQSLSDQMRSVVMQMQYEALQAESDSEDDMRDFDVEDDQFPRSPHELFVESPEYQTFIDDIERFAKDRKGKKADEESATKPTPAEPKQPSKAAKPPKEDSDPE